MNLFQKFKKATGANLTEPVNLFFIEHNERGYFTKPDFVNYVKPFSEHQFKHVENLFKYTSLRCKIVNVIEAKMDPKTQEFIIWVHIDLTKGKVKLPIPYDKGMLRFIEDYQQTNVWFEADLQSLLFEAGVDLNNI